VDKGEEVERYVEVVNHPEEVERLLSNAWVGKDEDKADYDPERHPGQTCQGLEQPVCNSWLLVTRKPKLRAKAV